jgi:hypothetical protein
MGLLSLIPIKDWIYGAIILALLISGGVYLHNRDMRYEQKGRQQIETADAKLAATVQKHNTDLQNAAADKDAAVEKAYAEGLSNAPIQPAPRVVCVRPFKAGSNGVSSTASGAGNQGKGPQSGVSAADSGEGSTLDIGPPITVRGKDADVQIKALQEDVQTLLQEMGNGEAHGPGR